MATSNEQKEEIKSLLLNGATHEEIAELIGVSKKTVQRIKKELTDNNIELAQQLTENKYNRQSRKSEEKYLKKIENEKYLFEDVFEGWIYHLTSEEIRHKAGGKWWSFIVYPESAPEDWKQKLRQTGCELAISPLHDKDVWDHDSPEEIDEETGEVIEEKGSHYKAGDRKKAHWHCIIKFDKSISFKEANDIIRNITYGPYAQKCMSLKGQYEYFIHLNNPEKYQYEKDEIEKYNNFIIEATQADRIILIDEIGRTINEQKFINIEQLRKFYEGQYEYINIIALKGYYFEKLTQVNYREIFPNGREVNVNISNLKELIKKLEER